MWDENDSDIGYAKPHFLELDPDELWLRIRSFHVEEEPAEVSFLDLLAQENGWSRAYAEKVYEEYLKFIYLVCTNEEFLTPSDQVEQAWHLHLRYTHSYWDRFCGEVLRRPLHHSPNRGGPTENKRHMEAYQRALKMYKLVFRRDAPLTIWPPAIHRYRDVPRQRIVSAAEYVILERSRFQTYAIIAAIVFVAILASWWILGGNGTAALAILGLFVLFSLYIYRHPFGGGPAPPQATPL